MASSTLSNMIFPLKCQNARLTHSCRWCRQAYSMAIGQDIQRSSLIIRPLANHEKKLKQPLANLVFGKYFTDHMLLCEWKNEAAANVVDSVGHQVDRVAGWSAPVIQKYESLVLPPSAAVFHYGLEIFEGMKAYMDTNHQIRLFRPMKNMERFSHSAARLSLPTFHKKEMLECIKALIRLEADWIPRERGYSLYIRPTMIGTQDSLGVSPTNKALFYTICCPVGPYYKTGFSAVSLIAETHHVRAWPGGTGCNKVGGNYAPGILPQLKANDSGYQQILWLFGEDAALTEVGTMNLFVFLENDSKLELVTPPLDGTILPGVTRDSVLTLTKAWNEFIVSERKMTMEDVAAAAHQGRIKEMFGVGTAAVVSSIKHIHWDGKDYVIPLDPTHPESQMGPLARRIRDTILDIQHGVKEFADWSVVVE